VIAGSAAATSAIAIAAPRMTTRTDGVEVMGCLEAAEAHRYLDRQQHVGKVLLTAG